MKTTLLVISILIFFSISGFGQSGSKEVSMSQSHVGNPVENSVHQESESNQQKLENNQNNNATKSNQTSTVKNTTSSPIVVEQKKSIQTKKKPLNPVEKTKDNTID